MNQLDIWFHLVESMSSIEQVWLVTSFEGVNVGHETPPAENHCHRLSSKSLHTSLALCLSCWCWGSSLCERLCKRKHTTSACSKGSELHAHGRLDLLWPIAAAAPAPLHLVFSSSKTPLLPRSEAENGRRWPCRVVCPPVPNRLLLLFPLILLSVPPLFSCFKSPKIKFIGQKTLWLTQIAPTTDLIRLHLYQNQKCFIDPERNVATNSSTNDYKRGSDALITPIKRTNRVRVLALR